MSDERLRELERRWEETGSSEDEAALLLEMVRIGALTKARLRSLAILGHPAALLAQQVSPGWAEGLSWLYALEELGRGVLLRAALAVLRTIYVRQPSCEAEVDEVIRIAYSYMLDPQAKHVEGKARAAANACNMASPGRMVSSYNVLLLGGVVGRIIHNPVKVALSDFSSYMVQLNQARIPKSGERKRVASVLIPWILDTGDPIRDWCAGFAADQD